MTQLRLKTKLGNLYLTASEKQLEGVFWQPQNDTDITDETEKTNEILKEAAKQITEYLDGERKHFSLKVKPKGTPFQQKVWQELAKIPYGQTISYKDLAAKANAKLAARAVGTAMAKNPLCIILPCHRVLPVSGKVGNYAGGPAIKSKLLKIEA